MEQELATNGQSETPSEGYCVGEAVSNGPRLACLSGTYWAGAEHSVGVANGLLEVRSRFSGGAPVGGGLRGSISAFSPQSRRRLMRTWAALPWHELRGVAFITLTYPGSAVHVPTDGQVAKAHLKAFRKRWERRFGTCRGTWKLEFQRRGAPHFHLWVETPEHVNLSALRLEVARWWWEIVGSEELSAFFAGTSVERARKHPAMYAAAYATKKSKEYQHFVPNEFANLGRWWGCWSMKADVQDHEISEEEAVRLRRVVRKLRVARIRSVPSMEPRRRARAIRAAKKVRSLTWVISSSVNEPNAFVLALFRAAAVSPPFP